MSRTTREWIGSTDDAKAPPRVQLRTFLRFKGRCVDCDMQIRRRRDWQLDHIVALINQGENREANLCVRCVGCHKIKTKRDVGAKAATAKTRLHHLGLKRSKTPMPFGKTSKFKRKITGEIVPR